MGPRRVDVAAVGASAVGSERLGADDCSLQAANTKSATAARRTLQCYRTQNPGEQDLSQRPVNDLELDRDRGHRLRTLGWVLGEHLQDELL